MNEPSATRASSVSVPKMRTRVAAVASSMRSVSPAKVEGSSMTSMSRALRIGM